MTVANWPVAELHVHIEGTLETELLVVLARRNDVALPSYDPDALRELYRFTDLQSFLDIYYANLAVLRTEADFYDLGMAYLTRASAAGVRRAEIFFDPQTHLANGIPLDVVFGGLTRALADARATLGISADLILCFLRHLGGAAALQTLDAAVPFLDQFIGVGLDSAEVGFPPSLFTEVFARAKALGLHRVAHAGEEGGPDYVHEALDLLGVERVDHGIRAIEDPGLVEILRERQVPLTVCPLSNVCLRATPTLAEHALPAMLAAGLLVTINSDDPAYFGGYIDDNLSALQREFGLDNQQLATLARNSFRASFLPEAEKRRHIADVDEHLEGLLRLTSGA
ncbi:adenosine deaminase [Cryobacterium adonitolivorans]|uniref:Adenine deaminase n=1 Tax=Cryobacterium adonitolivorans TaxID=1259189 RepID=A0A4R8W987_9MICO|nr:adenosine deaminase [Cryobacterium adonitolivorans]TFC05185.1 adenosine deaminase [Cryobacterium adonitolivorans]